MTRELLILRHAKSDWSTASLSDFERPLAGRGNKDAPRVGEWLRQQDLVPDAVVSSPAERAKQTALKVCEAMGVGKKPILWEMDIYAADEAALRKVLARCPAKADRILLIGHNPGLEDLLLFLAGDKVAIPPDGKLLPTAAVARLRMPRDWKDLSSGCARLLEIWRPAKAS